MKVDERFQFGDRVKHAKRPEWGIGTVSRAEDAVVDGKPVQRLTIRFPNGGMKTLIGASAELERAPEVVADFELAQPQSRLKAWERLKEQSDWLAPLAAKKIDEAMVSLPESVSDPFTSLSSRLKATMALYRFDRSGRGLVDWAVAQTGLDDPLSRFTRQELEQLFDRWAFHRDNHLRELLQSARYEQATVNAIVQTAPKPARDAVRRLSGAR